MNFDQSYEDNRREFIERLIAANWTREDAEREWDNIQAETEGSL